MNLLKKITTLVSITAAVATTQAQNLNVSKSALPDSLALEASSSIHRGVEFLISKQQPNGSWSFHPAITSLCTLAIANSKDAQTEKVKKSVQSGMKFIRSFVQKDGSIYNKNSKEYPNYSTAVSLITLAFVNAPEDQAIIKNAREFLINSQFTDISEDNPSFGGIGYGKHGRPDLSNTQLALEALYLTEDVDKGDAAAIKKSKLMWERAQKFLTRCQNLPETNDQKWASDNKDDKGGFIYLPENESSKAGEGVAKDGTKTLRSYGSMTYAGLKSMIYSKIDKNDIRIKAAYEWAMKNYTLDKNPGMDQQGLYYYIHTFTKALNVMGNDKVVDSKGVTHLWKVDLTKRLLSVQKGDGSWVNKEGRWWESMPELVTSYCLMSLNQAIGYDVNLVLKKQSGK